MSIIQRTIIDPIANTALLVGDGHPTGIDAATGSLYVRKDGGINNVSFNFSFIACDVILSL